MPFKNVEIVLVPTILSILLEDDRILSEKVTNECRLESVMFSVLMGIDWLPLDDDTNSYGLVSVTMLLIVDWLSLVCVSDGDWVLFVDVSKDSLFILELVGTVIKNSNYKKGYRHNMH